MKLSIHLFAFLFLFPAIVSAHPGHIQKDGCHICRTHCEQWNVPRGKKHCHHKKIKPSPISVIKTNQNAKAEGKVTVKGWSIEKKEEITGEQTNDPRK